ncbi:DUF4402 domain-containing protein [Caulobacter sp. LARHSG274]
MRASFSRPAAWRVCGAIAAATLMATAAYAAERTVAGTATIIRTMSVSTTAQMSFGRLQYNGAGPATASVVVRAAPPMARGSTDVQLLPNGGETPAIRVITGEPGRIYRVTPPGSATAAPGGLTVTGFTLWSANSGDITASRLGQLDAQGKDTIRIGASLMVPKGTKNDTFTANTPVTITYD